MVISSPKTDQKVLLELNGVKKYFPIKGGILKRVQGHVQAVQEVNLKLYEGESMSRWLLDDI